MKNSTATVPKVPRPHALLFPLVLLACPKKARPTDAGDAQVVDGGAPRDAVLADASASDGAVTVYPIEPNAPPTPLAQKLCAGLIDMPEQKRATCCASAPGVVNTAECTQALSAALRYQAVAIEEADVDKCVAAFDKALDGCDWVGPVAPRPPLECQNIVKGSFPEGTRCRSSLECASALLCRGLGPGTAGTCALPKLPGELCGGTVDTLASYLRDGSLEKRHPECSTAHCSRHRCAIGVGQEGPCQVSQDCAEGLQCLPTAPVKKVAPKASAAPAPPRKCVRRALPKEGEPCPGGVCAGDLVCVVNKCASRKAGGQDCANDVECRGGCMRSAGASKGKCGPRCDVR
jgi:hypothetical protein